MFIKLSNETIDQYPYTVDDLRRDNPNTSFPKTLPEETLAEYGLVKVQKTPQPDFDPTTSRPKEMTPVKQNGVWVQVWSVEAYADADERIRKERNRLLAASDWTQLADAPVDQTAWSLYRQALRDITLQEGFPTSVEWPSKPSSL